MALLPLPREFHPAFADPKTHPAGPVTIDHSHPLAPREFYYLPSEYHYRQDLVTGATMSDLTTTKSMNLEVGGDGTRVLRTSGSSDHGFVLPRTISVANAQPWIIHYKAKQNSGAHANAGMIVGTFAGSPGSYLWHRPNNTFSFLPAGASSIAFNTNFDSDVLATHSIVCIGTTIRGYLNGVYQGDEYTALGTTTLSLSEFIYGWITGNNYAFDGDTHYMYISSGRVFTDDMVKYLHENPYCFLKPAVPMSYSHGLSGGPAIPISILVDPAGTPY